MKAKTKKQSTQTSQPDTLTRGTLRLTFRTLRNSSPSTALLIQNLLMQQPLEGSHAEGNAYADRFAVALEDDHIEQIIQSILALCLINSQQQINSGSSNMVVLRELLSEWTKIADHKKLFPE